MLVNVSPRKENKRKRKKQMSNTKKTPKTNKSVSVTVNKINNAFADQLKSVVINTNLNSSPKKEKVMEKTPKTPKTPKDVKFNVKVGNDEPEQGVKVDIKEKGIHKDKTPKDKTAVRAVLVNLDMPTSVLFYELARSGKFFDKNNPTAVARALIEQFVSVNAPKQDESKTPVKTV
jgi:hypothetical protein